MNIIAGSRLRSTGLAVLVAVICSAAMLQGCKGKSKTVALPDTPAPAPVVQLPSTPQGLVVSSTTKTLHFNWASLNNVDYYRLLENRDGLSGFSQKGSNLSATQYSFGVAAHFYVWPGAKYLLEACNTRGCSQSTEAFAASSMIGSIGYFKPDMTPANVNNYYGWSVALSADGNTLAVGVPFDDSSAIGINGNLTGTAITNSGAVYVYRRNGSSWLKEAYVKASNAGSGDVFGGSVSLSADGNTLAIGASGESSNAMGVNNAQDNNNAFLAGAAYVFKRSNSTWTQQAYIKASNTEAGDQFGVMLALSGDGNTLAVGAINEDSSAVGIDGNQSSNSQFDSGAVYVFAQNNNNWAQQVYIKASNTDTQDLFGNSIALSEDGNTLAVSAYWEGSNAVGVNGTQTSTSASFSGSAYVFTRNATTWSQQAYIKASNARMNAHFGNSLSLAADGNTLAISSFQESSNAVGVDGNQASTSALGSGAAYVFARDATVWSQQSYLKASNTESNDRFGYNLKLSADGSTLAVGATDEDSNGTGLYANQIDNSASGSGAAYVFTRALSTWQQASYVKAPNTNANDEFGRTVALSADGSVLAVGAVGEESTAPGINGDQAINVLNDAGAVYVY